jgi:hypothetical protein
MFLTVLFFTGIAGLAIAVALGWVPDTTQPGRGWYPAGPDPEPWRND